MLSKEEYQARRAKDMEAILEKIKRIKESSDPLVRYRDVKPVLDIKHMFETSVDKFGERPAFWTKKGRGSPYASISYKEAFDDVNGLGTSLIEGGMKGKKIAVIGENSYEWAISYLAAVCGTGVVVPLDKELPAVELKQLIVSSGCSCVIFGSKFESVFKDIHGGGETKLEILVNMETEKSKDGILSLRELVEAGKNLVAGGNCKFTDAQIDREEMSVILFTSGTTGFSKGVMLSHKNLAEEVMLAPTIIRISESDVFFSVLPVHHTYECTAGFLVPLYAGASIAYCEGLKYIAKNLQEIRPTIFLGVPVLFENLYSKIWQNARKKGKEATLKKMIDINKRTKKIGIDIGPLFLKDIKAVFGGRMRVLICGGAAINPEVLQGLRDFGVLALQGYGLTESAPIGALNPETAPVNESAGRALPGTSIRIEHPDPETGIGEICLAGDNIMLGYYDNPEATEEALKGGWYYTGDLGWLDERGYLYITGRKKNVIITKNGKNVYPEELEYHLNLIPYVAECMVWGKDSEYGEDTVIIAAILPDSEAVAEKLGQGYSGESLEKLLWEEIDMINKEQPFFKRIKKIKIRKEEFEKNTSKKIKRYLESNKE
ncbi:MAG: AMP-binding protein [Clostridiales bacterium]|nr:AMP-binding protein [Clostridiales bacterium]